MEWINYIIWLQSSHFRYSLVNNKMRKKNQLALAIIITICACSACNTERYIYTPSIPNNPYFREKGESKLAAYYSSGGDDNPRTGHKNNGFDLQGAYALSKNWAITTSFFSRQESDIYTSSHYNFFDSSYINYKRHITDFGGGYFVPLNRRQNAFFAIYGGIGFGEFSINDKGIDRARNSYSRFHNSDITKWFIQPSFNFFAGNYFRMALIGKFSFVHYGNISTSYLNEELQYYWLDRIKSKTISFFEPTLNIQFGIPPIDWVKIDGGFTFSSDPFEEPSRAEARNFNASIGLSFDFSKIKKNK